MNVLYDQLNFNVFSDGLMLGWKLSQVVFCR